MKHRYESLQETLNEKERGTTTKGLVHKAWYSKIEELK